MRSKDSYNGIFLSRDGAGAGHLKVAGKDTSLTIVSKEMERLPHGEWTDVHGTLADGTKASLLDCVGSGWSQHRVLEGVHYEAECFPHYIALGERFIVSTDKVVRAVRYYFENADCLVMGHRTFRSLHPTKDEAQALLKSEHLRTREIAKKNGWDARPFDPQIGDHPELLYFSGVWEIIKCSSDAATVTLNNRTSRSMGSSKGIGIENEVASCIEFFEPKTVREAAVALYRLHSLYELALGRRQRYVWIELELDGTLDEGAEHRPRLQLLWSYCNEDVSGETKPTNFGDILVDVERRSDEFSKIVSNWLNTYPTLGDARNRFASAFHHGSYSVDRIVGAANMFDLLPEESAPKKKEIDDATKDAVAQCRSIFKALPEGHARQSVLDAFGRVGTASLTEKVFHRANILATASPEHFPEILLPCKEAVRCRNHYVHGSIASFNYTEEISAFAFLADTLEFVFAASDLIELGWDLDGWRKQGSTMSHPFGAYCVNYTENLSQLKALIGV